MLHDSLVMMSISFFLFVTHSFFEFAYLLWWKTFLQTLVICKNHNRCRREKGYQRKIREAQNTHEMNVQKKGLDNKLG